MRITLLLSSYHRAPRLQKEQFEDKNELITLLRGEYNRPELIYHEP